MEGVQYCEAVPDYMVSFSRRQNLGFNEGLRGRFNRERLDLCLTFIVLRSTLFSLQHPWRRYLCGIQRYVLLHINLRYWQMIITYSDELGPNTTAKLIVTVLRNDAPIPFRCRIDNRCIIGSEYFTSVHFGTFFITLTSTI
jgi:hypothetical protein